MLPPMSAFTRVIAAPNLSGKTETKGKMKLLHRKHNTCLLKVKKLIIAYNDNRQSQDIYLSFIYHPENIRSSTKKKHLEREREKSFLLFNWYL